MTVMLEWLGVSTFRLVVNDTVIFLDAYMDRVPSAETIARNTGATVIGPCETVRINGNLPRPCRPNVATPDGSPAAGGHFGGRNAVKTGPGMAKRRTLLGQDVGNRDPAGEEKASYGRPRRAGRS